ncbi:MAG: hypothetical protein RL346_2208 [Verrucomicrobiota bacterium]|jgi:small-conductance mechanosensitive channel
MTESNSKKTNAVKSRFQLIPIILLLSLPAGPAGAQLEGLLKAQSPNGKSEKKSSVPIGQQLEIWKAEVDADLANLEKLTQAGGLPPNAGNPEVEGRKRTLERTQLAIGRHFDALKSISENGLALDAARKSLKEWTGYGEKSPTSILVVDELNNRKQAIIEKKASDQSSLEIYHRTLNGWLEDSKKLETKISEAQKAHDAPSADKRSTLWNLTVEKERQRLLFIQSSALQQTIAAIKTGIQTHDAELALLNQKITEAEKTASLREEDITQIKAASSDRQKALRTETEALRSRQNKAASDESKALEDLQKIQASPNPDPALVELAEITLEAARARVSSIQQMITSIESFSQIEAFIPEAYQHRLVLLDSGSTPRERQESIAALQSLHQRLTAWDVVANNSLKAITAALTNEQVRSNALPADDPRITFSNRIRTTLWERQALLQRLIQSISIQLSTLDSWLALYLSTHQTPFHERLIGSLGTVRDAVKRIWNFPVNQYEEVIEKDGQRIITLRDISLGTVLIGIVLFIIAYCIAANISKRIQRALVRRKFIGENQARTLRNWLMLIVAFLLALATLNWLSIPLTIFAFLAGALAIGVGFGTQTIIRNFISGIILLFERKVRVGDTIEVDGVVGVVSEINTRSSIVRGFNGIENLIPNSLFLENRVVNWTLHNRNIRREIRLGVTYGAPTQEVIRILTEAADRHGLVLKDPAPIATLANFGDNSLDFILYFWIEQNEKTSAIVVESDLRIMIEKRLTEAGISVPFPQRDVHLEMSKPLQISLTR